MFWSQARELFEQIVSWLDSDSICGLEHSQIESKLLENGYELLRRLLPEFIQLMLEGDNMPVESEGLYHLMAACFEGLRNLEWSLFKNIFPKPPEKREGGMPHSSFRYVLNTLLYIFITGCHWCHVPKGEIWA